MLKTSYGNQIIFHEQLIAQSGGDVEYTDWFSAVG